ncbi:MAG TPA: hypothetical protein ENH41_05800 [Candidatus Omnitrophica bacterium]|nr:hypothetical protein [Candidatus Omnitrophota bacterium]
MIDLSFFKEKKEIIKPLAIIAIVLIFDLIFILRPQIIFLTKVVPEAGELKKKVVAAKKDIASKDNLAKRHKELNEKIVNYEGKIIHEEEVPLFLSEISRIAKVSDVELMQIRPLVLDREATTDYNGRIYSRLAINLDLRCGYHHLGRFVNNLETADRYIKVLSFDAISVNDPPFEYPIKMMIETYVINKDEKKSY